MTKGFVPPPYPYDRLDSLRAKADAHPGGCVDLSIGSPCDPPPRAVVDALSASGAERGYPLSIGSAAYREAAAAWMARRLGAELDPATQVAACIGTKELVVGIPHWLRLRHPDRDTVLYPAIAYPSYEMGAVLAGCRAVPYTTLESVPADDAARALCLWVNVPANPTGELDDLGAAARWGRARRVPVLSDECYVEFTWDGPPRTIVEHGTEGVLAVHSLSKRSNLAGVRAGFYAGDADLVGYLRELRKHAGFMLPGPVQAAGAIAYADDTHVDAQRERYSSRLERMRVLLRDGMGIEVPMPRGAFYLWAPSAPASGWDLAERLAAEAGVLSSPGDLYGHLGAAFVRLAMVQPDEAFDLVSRRLGAG